MWAIPGVTFSVAPTMTFWCHPVHLNLWNLTNMVTIVQSYKSSRRRRVGHTAKIVFIDGMGHGAWSFFQTLACGKPAKINQKLYTLQVKRIGSNKQKRLQRS
jgi:hypothetical protein